MNILITGATGFVGSFLAEKLLEKGHRVRTLVRTTSNLHWIADLNVECFYGSLSDKDSLSHAIKDMDYIYHLAGVTKARNTDDYYRVNYEGTKNLIDVIRAGKVSLNRLLVTSSQAAVGPSPGLYAIDEKSEPHPLTDYGRSKLKAEQYALAHKKEIPITVVRPPAVYGPRDTDVLQLFKTFKKGLIPKLGGTDRYLSLIHVYDLVDGMILAAERKKSLGRTYFLANPQPYSIDRLAELTLQYFGKRGFRINIPVFAMEGIASLSEGISKLTGKPSILNSQKVLEMKPEFWICSPQRAMLDFNFKTRISLEEGIVLTLKWYEEQGWL